MDELNENYNLKKYLQEIVSDKLKVFEEITRWGEQEKEQFAQLLADLERPFDKDNETTKEKGDKLEKLVEFIIRNSYFYDIYKNIRTETNEIDEIIILSDRGKQALSTYGLNRELLPTQQEIFLGECKNYKTSLSVTYVGKFYSLLIATDTTFGLIFTRNGLSGRTAGYTDAYGLTKILRLIEKYKNNSELCILTFTTEDYHKLLEGQTFFELIKAKKLELQMASNYQNFLQENAHENLDEIKSVIQEKLQNTVR